jgi:hypothetical protein
MKILDNNKYIFLTFKLTILLRNCVGKSIDDIIDYPKNYELVSSLELR